MKNKFIFITGGVKSGKSRYAVDLAKQFNRVVFVATAECLDDEMKARIECHKKERPVGWVIIEESLNIAEKLLGLSKEYEIILIDCLGVFINNMMFHNFSDKQIEKKIRDLSKEVKQVSSNIIIVSNDVGSGIVPENELARRFRDLVGNANQIMAQNAEEVFFMQCGIPIKIKN